MPFMIIAYQTSTWQYCSQALFKAVGQTKKVMRVQSYFYGFVNFPLMYILCVHFKLGNIGIWLAIFTNTFMLSVYMFYLQITLDWDEAVRESERMKKLESS